MSLTIEARFMTTCPECEEWIHVGDRIKPDPLDGSGKTWIHEHCPKGRFDIVRPVCTDCFTEKAVDGSCMCEAGA